MWILHMYVELRNEASLNHINRLVLMNEKVSHKPKQ